MTRDEFRLIAAEELLPRAEADRVFDVMTARGLGAWLRRDVIILAARLTRAKARP